MRPIHVSILQPFEIGSRFSFRLHRNANQRSGYGSRIIPFENGALTNHLSANRDSRLEIGAPGIH